MEVLKFKRLHPDALLPAYATPGSAGMDICFQSGEFENDQVTLWAGDRSIFPTGLAVEIPEGYELQCRPRSGLAAKAGIMVVNSPGTIDSDYRGEIKVILLNTGGREVNFKNGDRIAQLVLAKTPKLPIFEVEELTDTERGLGGFGSTGR